jgi:hypothetical protein
MPVTFYGKWSLEVVGNLHLFEERVRIVGSLASDGTVDGAVGTQVADIDGTSWDIFMEEVRPFGVWEPQLIFRIPSVTPQDGLIVTLYSVPPQDGIFTVKFKYLNTQVNPPGPSTPPFGFTLPPSSFRPPGPPRARTKVSVVPRLEIRGKTPF